MEYGTRRQSIMDRDGLVPGPRNGTVHGQSTELRHSHTGVSGISGCVRACSKPEALLCLCVLFLGLSRHMERQTATSTAVARANPGRRRTEPEPGRDSAAAM